MIKVRSKAKSVILLAAAAVLTSTGANVLAQTSAQTNADKFVGTWECFGPGQTSATTPPILHIDNAKMTTVEIDGFNRAASGVADVSAESDGTTKITPASGAPMFIKAFSDNGRRVTMQLRRDGVGDYRCSRLPKFDNAMIPRDRTVSAK